MQLMDCMPPTTVLPTQHMSLKQTTIHNYTMYGKDFLLIFTEIEVTTYYKNNRNYNTTFTNYYDIATYIHNTIDSYSVKVSDDCHSNLWLSKFNIDLIRSHLNHL